MIRKRRRADERGVATADVDAGDLACVGITSREVDVVLQFNGRGLAGDTARQPGDGAVGVERVFEAVAAGIGAGNELAAGGGGDRRIKAVEGERVAGGGAEDVVPAFKRKAVGRALAGGPVEGGLAGGGGDVLVDAGVARVELERHARGVGGVGATHGEGGRGRAGPAVAEGGGGSDGGGCGAGRRAGGRGGTLVTLQLEGLGESRAAAVARCGGEGEIAG